MASGVRLPDLYAQEYARAVATGQPRGVTLSKGARVAILVKGSVSTVTFSRQGTKLGDQELIIFRRDCAIPPEATRWPETGQAQRADDQGATWHYVAYRWASLEADPPERDDLL